MSLYLYLTIRQKTLIIVFINVDLPLSLIQKVLEFSLFLVYLNFIYTGYIKDEHACPFKAIPRWQQEQSHKINKRVIKQ